MRMQMNEVFRELPNVNMFEMMIQMFEEKIEKMIEKANKPEVKYYSYKQVAQLLGVSRPTVDNWVRLGKLSCSKIEGRFIFSSTDIEELMSSNRI